MTAIKIFVYGQLCRDGVANHLMRDAEFLREAKVRGYTLCLAFDQYLAAVPGDGVVEGELWEVSEEALHRVDQYEREGVIYRREKVKLDGGESAYMYVWNLGQEHLSDL